MTHATQPSIATMVRRGVARRCPRCGAPAFVSYFELKKTCSRCGIAFEREPGYWVGALIINTTITFALFLAVFVGGAIITWPDVPWGWLMALTLLVNGVIPVLFYPVSKTLWSAFEMSWHPIEPSEIKEASHRIHGDG